MNRDPVGEWGGPNIHTFCANVPIGRVDAIGLEWIDLPEVVTELDVSGGLLEMLEDRVWTFFFGFRRSTYWQDISEDTAFSEISDDRCCLGVAYECTVTKTKELSGRGRIYVGAFKLPEGASTLERNLAEQLLVASRGHELGHRDVTRGYILGVGEVEHAESFRDCWSASLACGIAETLVDLWFDDELGRHKHELGRINDEWDATDRPRQRRFREWIRRQLVNE